MKIQTVIFDVGNVLRAEIFLYDSPANCQGAEAFGIRTILVQDRAAARRELRKLLA